jgi:hypothetical protein
MTDEKPTFWQQASRWLSVDNVCLLVGIALITLGASQWSARVGLVTCGALVLGVTLLRVLLDGRR